VGKTAVKLPLKKLTDRRFSPFLFGFSILIVFALYTGCSTAPKTMPASSLIDILPEEQTVYLKMDVRSNLDLMGQIFNQKGDFGGMIGEAMARTDAVLVALTIPEDESREFSVVASGSYPKGIIESRLKKDKTWKKEKKGFIHWKNEEMGLQMFFPEKNVIALSNGNIGRIADRISAGERYSLPRELRHELDISDLVFFMPDPGKEIMSSVGGGSRIYPIRMIWVTMYNQSMDVVFLMDDEENAGKFSKVARLLIAALMMREEVGDIKELRKNMKVFVDGKNVRLEDIPVSTEDLQKIFAGSLAGAVE